MYIDKKNLEEMDKNQRNADDAGSKMLINVNKVNADPKVYLNV